MKIDGKALREAAEAHEARLASAAWTPSDVGDDSWVDEIASAASAPSQPKRMPQAQPMPRDIEPDVRSPASPPHLEVQGRAVETLTDMKHWRPSGTDAALPAWLEVAAGNPHTYDAPDATRMGVFARIRPATYDRLRLIQQRVGLRTAAGTWEFLLRLGLAAAERLPSR